LQGALETYCRRMAYDADGVEDVLQSAVAKAYRDFHRYAEGTNFRAWMFRYLHFEVLETNRKFQRGRHDPLPAEPTVEDAWQMALDEPLVTALLDRPELILDQCDAELFRAVRSLAPLERSVLLLRAVGEFKYREMSEILKIPIGTVMSSLARCREKLRRELAVYCQDQGIFMGER